MACVSQMMARNLRNGFKEVEDLKLLKRLRSSIQEFNRPEHSRDPSEEVERGSLGGFVLDPDSQHTKTVTLRRKFDSGEEITISAILSPPIRSEIICLLDDIFMKVCVKKPALSSIMRFDCTVYGYSNLVIKKAYLGSPSCLSSSIYSDPLFRMRKKHPWQRDSKYYLEIKHFKSQMRPTFLSSSDDKNLFSKLDLKLHDTLQYYLIAKGIGVSLTEFIYCYLCRRSRDERYVNWCKEVEAFVAK